MKQISGVRLMVPLLLVCLGLGFVYHAYHSNLDRLRNEYRQIDLAAHAMNLPALVELSRGSKNNFQSAYIEYRLALAAEKALLFPEMEAALSRSLGLLEALKETASAEVYALAAAIHLKRLSLSESPELHRAALDQALLLGHELEPENPAILLVAAEAMAQNPGSSASQTAMAELLRHEAGVQLDRLCRSLCPRKESVFVWQGLLDSLERDSRASGSRLLAQASCASASAASGS